MACLTLSTGALSSCEQSTNSPSEDVKHYLNEDAQNIKGLQDRVRDLESKMNDLEGKRSDLERKVNNLGEQD
jgi:TolA-binding protein